MKNSLTHLPFTKQREIKAIATVLRAQPEVEMVILFGSYARGNWVEDAYVEDNVLYQYRSDYDLLVVVKTRSIGKQCRLENELTAAIYQLPNIYTPFSVIVHDGRYINTQLGEGQYFFSDIKNEGILLYSSGNVRLQEAVKELSPAQRYEFAKEDFEHWYKNALEFKIDFGNALQRGSYNIAAFQLHQVTERLYNAIFLVYTRYKPKTHDLAVLRKLVHTLDQRPITIFPLSTPEEERLFKLLRDAYIDARYKKTYVITEQELLWLAERVNALQTLTETLCQEKMQTFLAK